MMDLHLGLVPSVILSVLAGLVFGVVYYVRSVSDPEDIDEHIVAISLFSSGTVSVFCVVFPLFNTILNFYYNREFFSLVALSEVISSELGTGVLLLRGASIVVGGLTIKHLLDSLSLNPLPNLKDERALFDFPESNELGWPLPTYRNRLAHLYLGITQNAMYEAGIILLWVSHILNVDNILGTLLTLAIYFIADDWRIIFRYSLALKGQILNTHSTRIWIGNVVIVIIGATYAYTISWIALIAFVLISLIILRLLLLLKEGYIGNMTIYTVLDWKNYKFKGRYK